MHKSGMGYAEALRCRVPPRVEALVARLPHLQSIGQCLLTLILCQNATFATPLIANVLVACVVALITLPNYVAHTAPPRSRGP